MARIRGTGLYLVTVTFKDGTKDRWRDPIKQQAIATARSYSLLGNVASADVHKTDCGPGRRSIIDHVGHYEQNRHLRAAQA